jgi:hypothetical protein
MKTSFSKRKALFLFVLSLFAVVCYNSQSIRLSDRDKEYLLKFQHDWHLDASEADVHKDFNSEFNFITLLQDSVVAEIKHEEIPHRFFGDISFYYNNRKGFCYDRAVLMEKFFTLYHFSFRHTYIFFGKDGKEADIKSFFEEGVNSHAGIEVKTKKGWMAMGTNANWVGVTTKGELLTYSALRSEIRNGHLDLKKSMTEGEAFWIGKGSNYRSIYGIYSRHGDFFSHGSQNLSSSMMQSPFHVLPDYNLRMLIYNFLN